MSFMNNVADIPSSLCNKKEARQAVQRQHICITDAYHYYIIDTIYRCDNIEYERQIQNDAK